MGRAVNFTGNVGIAELILMIGWFRTSEDIEQNGIQASNSE
jgi:hypothetical protein